MTTLLPPAPAEFIVISDTHLVDADAPHAREYPSRLRQNDRIAAALRTIAGARTIVHLGDLVQDYPTSSRHEALLIKAVAQLRELGADLHVTPGNTDVGDKPDPSSPAAAASAESLDRFRRATGSCWSAFDAGPLHGILITASLLNSGLEPESEQWTWLEREIEAHADRRTALFFHYPLFQRDRTDPGVGNYDAIGDPARSRLIKLIERYRVEAVFTGHSHFATFNAIGRARLHGAPSTSFTRPGFSELFSSAPPPDRGRDDVPKLGVLLVRVHEDGLRVHPIRTAELEGPHQRPVVSGLPRDLPESRLGVILRHPIAQLTQVPDVFPSVVRQTVRNDYPLLACLELGARHVSVAAGDLADPHLVPRLQLLRDEGVRIIARHIWPSGPLPAWPGPDAPVDEMELVLLDRAELSSSDRLALAERASADRPIVLSTLVRHYRTGAELPRWRYGFTADEVAAVDGLLEDGPNSPIAIRIVANAPDLDAIRHLAAAPNRRRVDIVATVRGDDDEAAARLTAQFLECCAQDGGRFLVDPFGELDRTLDVSPGLLDRQCNPRPGFHALRILNSLVSDPGARVTATNDRYQIRRPGLAAVVSPGPWHSPADGDVVLLGAGCQVDGPGALPPGPIAWLAT